MEHLLRPFAVLVTKWNNDELFAARIKLMLLYTGTTVVLLGTFSYLLFSSIQTQLGTSIREQVADPILQILILDKANEVLKSRIIFADLVVLGFIIVIGLLLTERTLAPVRKSINRERRFVANASHELRTPLAVMKTNIEVALRNEKMPSSLARETLENVLVEVNDMTTLANTLLDLARQRESAIATASVALIDVVTAAVKKLQPLLDEKGITANVFAEATDITIQGDTMALLQMSYNILNNAIQYSERGDTITVKIKRDELGTITITFADTGMGIAKDKLAFILQPFFRAHDLYESTTGTGLGLTIVKEIVDRHYGSINIESELGKGTTVVISFPNI